jgi:hypothetical protein
VLHPVQDVARLLQPVGRAALARSVLAILLILSIAHVLGRFLKALDRLLQARIADRSGTAALRATAGLLSGLPLLPLLALLPLLSLLSLLALLTLLAGLVRRIAALQLLHLPLQLFGFPSKHLLFPTLAEGLLLIFLGGQFLLAAREFGQFLERGVDFLGAGVA